jgi:hypothetical protein
VWGGSVHVLILMHYALTTCFMAIVTPTLQPSHTQYRSSPRWSPLR